MSAAMPLYALVDPDERVVSAFAGLERDPQKFLRFLKTRPGA
jgi:hypothetical protein